ncbi:MAG: DUF4783 domain-containing protein [Bacteroidota bacterium]
MIRTLFILLLTGLAFMAPVHAQTTLNDAATQFELHVKARNVAQLTSMLAPRVDINLFGADKQYSRAQARFVLAGFFAQHPLQRLDLRTPSPSGKQGFLSGVYTVQGSGERLRLYARLVHDSDDDTWYLRELRLMRTSR